MSPSVDWLGLVRGVASFSTGGGCCFSLIKRSVGIVRSRISGSTNKMFNELNPSVPFLNLDFFYATDAG